ncbi:MAG: gamma carbonic anhydrase family protein [Eubacteriales bacterium]|nr:gamma carbonic anhydrase family protein [Eubacteriales bacterium]
MTERKKPQIASSAFIAPDAAIYGDVRIGEECSVWFHATVRAGNGDVRIGARTNVQDNCVIHVDKDFSVRVGEGVTIGHGAIVHGCSVGDNSLIGMGAILLNGAVIGKDCIIGAGALVTQNTVIPDGMLVLGSPGKVVRRVRPEEMENNRENARHYVEEGREYKNELG